ncbi:PREDICTED: uncharacterized protein LOC105449985 isoform X5 [Wasmannia auropunctata]|uniref:uncharacterized protein LOC105449985 isoform X5 n=1 Tax=Wasmannia auropunctata TaxID=64793 RepID=UPI0005F02890|nr:PREDICTED: uncharacterized protein LOC105449985 isoform X5 [Wasmannia auropunctata]
MQFFDGRNYRINKVLLSCVGQWPYQTNRSSNAIIIIIVSLAGTQFIAKICGLLSIDDIDVFIDSLSPLVVDLGCGVKLITCILKATEIRALFDQIQYDWQLLITSPHIKILNNYAQSGRTFTIIYASAFYSALVFFMLVPLQPLLLGSSSNETTRPLLHQVEYYIDMEKYYFPILIHGYVTAVICATARKYSKRRFASLIEAVFSQMFLVVAGFNMLIISMTGVMAVTNLDKPEEFLRQITFSCALLTHLFFESFLAQRLIDHSTHILISLTNIAWYQTSSRTRKILIFMIMKTREPCVLTAGKMFVISMDTFSTIVRTSVSYFTMLRSMQ